MNKPSIIIREATVDDAHSLMILLRALDSESDYMFFLKNERSERIEKYQHYLTTLTSNRTCSTLLLAEMEGQLIGFVAGDKGSTEKKSHVVTMSVGVLKKYQVHGIGRGLVLKAIEACRQHGAKKIEACVMANNQLSINLCKKIGFMAEGLKQKSIGVNGTYYDELMLGLMLE